ncbi:DUF726 domain-containing protein [Tropicibacter sp. Alg240-R139]|uniref:DUF726 domain-containing protein n=1 Tax=Tropicibacter sp. Alg240-R139 TaxID=2305991 RepID=UPI0013DF7801|nr:DUF726 domain-containing protein [Tropicibacter sp. Alg240-R139]
MDSLIRQTRDIPGPVVIMAHGYSYRTHDPVGCPHNLVFSTAPKTHPKRVKSWPVALGLDSSDRLSIAFGWDAHGTLWSARQRALQAGQALANVVLRLKQENPIRPVHFIGHSLGIELALEALHQLEPGHLNRIISLTGAAYRTRALEALTTRAGTAVEFFNVTTRENDLFDFLFEWIIAPPAPRDRAIGLGISVPNAVTLQLDCGDSLDALSCLGVSIAPSGRRVCHWSSYMRPGVFTLYERLLSTDKPLSVATLKDALPSQAAARWSRLFALPRYDFPLPFVQNSP